MFKDVKECIPEWVLDIYNNSGSHRDVKVLMEFGMARKSSTSPDNNIFILI